MTWYPRPSMRSLMQGGWISLIRHSRDCKLLLSFKQLLQRLNRHDRVRSLDVAGGYGRVTKHLLLHEYETVDLFD